MRKNIIDVKQRNLEYDERLGSLRGITGKHGKYDCQILKLLEYYKCMTIEQISYYTYKDYFTTARRLRKLSDYGVVASFMDGLKSEKYYHTGTVMKTHELLKRKVMFEFVKLGLISKPSDGFRMEVELLDGVIRCDLLVAWSYEGKEYLTLAEVDYTHETNAEKIANYERAFAQGIEYDGAKRRFNLLILKQNESVIDSSILDIIQCRFEDIHLNIEDLIAYRL